MKTNSKTVKAGLATVAVLMIATVVQGGDLFLHPDAYAGWTGGIGFVGPGGLAGTLEYAVFTAADFNANFGAMGYTPTSTLVYTYQVFVTGTATVSAELIGLANPAQDIGSFDIGDILPTSSSLSVPGTAMWNFTSPDIATGESSYGLAFSSPKVPEWGSGLTINHGSSALLLDVLPVPSANDVPEPATLALVGIGSLLMISRRRR